MDTKINTLKRGLRRLHILADFNPDDGTVVTCMYSYDGEGWKDGALADEDLSNAIVRAVRVEVQERLEHDMIIHREASHELQPGQSCFCKACLGCQFRHTEPRLPKGCACVSTKVCICPDCLAAITQDAPAN